MQVRDINKILMIVVFCLTLSACSSQRSGHSDNSSAAGSQQAADSYASAPSPSSSSQTDQSDKLSNTSPVFSTISEEREQLNLKLELKHKYEHRNPSQWGENVTGVKRKLNTKDKVVALTLDACGGTNGNGYDHKLIDYLIQEQIPATLFINSRWIDANYETFMAISHNPLFEIENHGSLHEPLSVSGKSVYGIKGTKNVGEVVDEVLVNENKIEALTGRKPIFFRSGTAFYDNVAASIVNELGLEPVNFNVLGDAGATYTVKQIRQAFQSSAPGSIIISHMNHPEKDVAEGIKLGIQDLKKKGYGFVKLASYPLL
jgi:peptidoglycan/xylan/chitin deacetylase (PgdA/CDA1 family)